MSLTGFSRQLACWAVLLATCSGCSTENPASEVQVEAESAAKSSAEAGSTEPHAAVGTPAVDGALPPRTEVPQLLTSAELDEGWIALWDGETLFGWHDPQTANWRVENGALVADSGQVGLLTTTTRFADYVLKYEFQADADTNSGVFLHTPRAPAAPNVDCYELNIAPASNPFPTGSLVGRQKIDPDLFQKAQAEARDGWHSVEVSLDGPRVQVRWNGMAVLDYTDPQPLNRGLIGLQHNQGRVAFRRLKLKPLNLGELWNGTDLTGWKTHPRLQGQFTPTAEGWLRVTGGRGQLESDATFADFVLQFKARTNAPGLNSGVFFRCIPGDEMMGYESQIHHGFRQGDRTQPVDCGTGGIFRRQNARLVAADDLEWFHETLVADGPHVSVWVNGYQVTDWRDTRAADPNPRKGLRLEAGSLMLQAHDPTTDLTFARIRAAEL